MKSLLIFTITTIFLSSCSFVGNKDMPQSSLSGIIQGENTTSRTDTGIFQELSFQMSVLDTTNTRLDIGTSVISSGNICPFYLSEDFRIERVNFSPESKKSLEKLLNLHKSQVQKYKDIFSSTGSEDSHRPCETFSFMLSQGKNQENSQSLTGVFSSFKVSFSLPPNAGIDEVPLIGFSNDRNLPVVYSMHSGRTYGSTEYQGDFHFMNLGFQSYQQENDGYMITIPETFLGKVSVSFLKREKVFPQIFVNGMEQEKVDCYSNQTCRFSTEGGGEIKIVR